MADLQQVAAVCLSLRQLGLQTCSTEWGTVCAVKRYRKPTISALSASSWATDDLLRLSQQCRLWSRCHLYHRRNQLY